MTIRSLSGATILSIVSLLVSSLISIGGAFVSVRTSLFVQDRQRAFEQVRAFDDASAKLLEAGAGFISSINSSTDIKGAREKLGVVLSQQALTAVATRQKLRKTDVPYADEYAAALKDLNAISQRVSAPVEMRAWAEAFGRVLDTKSSLSQALSANPTVKS